jgi:hypothetical protein
MNQSPFTRVTPGRGARMLHVAKDQHPNEALCGRPLAPDAVSPKGRIKCSHCSVSIKRANA